MENNGELSILVMIAVPPKDNPQESEQTKIVCHYYKEPGHVTRDCRKGMKKKQDQRKES